MILPKSRVLIAGAFFLLISVTVHAQPKNPTTDASQNADKALRDKAFALLESLAGQIPTLPVFRESRAAGLEHCSIALGS